MIKKFFDQAGNLFLKERQDEKDYKKLVLCNQIAVSLAIICAPHIIPFAIWGLDSLAWVIGFYTVVYSLIPFLQLLKKPSLVKYAVMCAGLSIVGIISVLLGRNSWIHLFYLIYSPLAFVLFDLREKYKLISFSAIPLILFLTLELWLFNVVTPLAAAQDISFLIYVTCVPSVFIIQLIYISYFKIANSRVRLISLKNIEKFDPFLTI